jgi:hypothetical protein
MSSFPQLDAQTPNTPDIIPDIKIGILIASTKVKQTISERRKVEDFYESQRNYDRKCKGLHSY